MAEKVIMPKQGLQMTEGTITKWIVREGENCVSGQPLFEMETDKLVITIDANVTGKLLKIIAPEGATVPITETIAIIGQAGDDISALLAQGKPSLANTPAATPPALRLPTYPRRRRVQLLYRLPRLPARFMLPPAPDCARKKRTVERRADCRKWAGRPDYRARCSDVYPAESNAVWLRPSLRQEGVDVSDAVGSGAHGKVTRADIDALIAARKGSSGRTSRHACAL